MGEYTFLKDAALQVPSLAICAVMLYFFLRYLQARDAQWAATIADIVASHNEARRESRQVIAQNTAAMQANVQCAQRNSDALERVESALKHFRCSSE